MDHERRKNYPLRRRTVVQKLLEERDGTLIVAGLGASAWDVTAAGDHPLTFPLWGAMGGAVAMGLGLALAQPSRRILTITGDGELLMGIGTLATVAVQQPQNLVIVVLDNECYGETGMQATHTAGCVDLAAIAAANGVDVCATIKNDAQLESILPRIKTEQGPCFFTIKVRAEKLPLVLPPKDGAFLKDRFRCALLEDRVLAEG